MAKPSKGKWLKRAGLAAGIAASLATAGHFGLKARVNHLNQGIAERNAARKPVVVAKEVPAQLAYGKLLQGNWRDVVYNPNKPGNCAGYATRAAELFFGKKFEKGSAWDLPAKNRVLFRASFDRKTLQGEVPQKKVLEMIDSGQISPGTLIGVFYPPSPNNRPERPFTHIVEFAGLSKGTPVFWHNIGGPNAISLSELYSAKGKDGSRLFFPVMVIVPKQ